MSLLKIIVITWVSRNRRYLDESIPRRSSVQNGEVELISMSLKNFIASSLTGQTNILEFVSAEPFQPTLITAGKVRGVQHILDLFANISAG